MRAVPSLALAAGLAAGMHTPLTAQDSVPPARVFTASAFDSDRGKLVLFGGIAGGGPDAAALADTWEYDGRHWTRLTPPTSPSARFFHAMAFDAARHRVVLFGGLSMPPGDPLADTWTWDGRTWTRGPDGPPGRGGHQMFYTPARPRVVLSGGVQTGQNVLADEWELDGAAWRQTRGPTPTETAAAAETAMGDTRLRAYRAAVRSDLRNLVTAQESFFADHVRYSASLDSLQFTPSRGVTIQFSGAVRPTGWAAIATHEGAPGARCAMFVGNATPPIAGAREGEPTCTGFPGDPQP